MNLDQKLSDSLYGHFNEKKQYDREEIITKLKGWIGGNQNTRSNFNTPNTIEFGDIIFFNIKERNHPCIIFKKENDICHGIILSTKSKESHFISKIKHSRLFPSSNFTSTVISLTEGEAKRNFVGIFDSPKELKFAIKLTRKKYKRIL